MPPEASPWLQAGMLKQGQSGFNIDGDAAAAAAAAVAAAGLLTGTLTGFIYDKRLPWRCLCNISEQRRGCYVKEQKGGLQTASNC